MTAKSDISPANWAALVEAGPAIARAVSASGGTAATSEQELGAFIAYVGDAAVSTDGGSLLGQLVGDVAGTLAGGIPAPDGDVYVDGLEKARKAGAILSVEADAEEAAAIRTWLLGAARAVAVAAKDGGVLGIGGTELSDWEKETIRAVGDALGA